MSDLPALLNSPTAPRHFRHRSGDQNLQRRVHARGSAGDVAGKRKRGSSERVPMGMALGTPAFQPTHSQPGFKGASPRVFESSTRMDPRRPQQPQHHSSTRFLRRHHIANIIDWPPTLPSQHPHLRPVLHARDTRDARSDAVAHRNHLPHPRHPLWRVLGLHLGSQPDRHSVHERLPPTPHGHDVLHRPGRPPAIPLPVPHVTDRR